ncbi:hypothetical protein [Pseudoalteromonas rubra]|uniref:hypothetical protein n=1 Tax=Pseudoalteromonas rubra TaxID=43658 RepID=UPI0013EEDBE0|nr:hypothetical protein [Pseudoalteromonas rubra]
MKLKLSKKSIKQLSADKAISQRLTPVIGAAGPDVPASPALNPTDQYTCYWGRTCKIEA